MDIEKKRALDGILKKNGRMEIYSNDCGNADWID